MNVTLEFIKYLAVMAGVTYLIRMIPLVLIKCKINNRYLKSFLYYIPYAVLTVMTIPAIFISFSESFSSSVLRSIQRFIRLSRLAYIKIRNGSNSCRI